MKDTLAEQGEPCTTVALSFDQFQLGDVALDHSVVDQPGEAGSHRLFVFLDASREGLQFGNATFAYASQPGI